MSLIKRIIAFIWVTMCINLTLLKEQPQCHGHFLIKCENEHSFIAQEIMHNTPGVLQIL